MNQRFPFHLSIVVADLEPAKRFYIGVLGARIGRENDEWVDILLWGHQITLQHKPEEVMPLERQGKRHFGVILPWSDWEDQAQHLRSVGTSFLSQPQVLMEGTPEEHGKFYLEDPSHNVIEVKAYRDVSTVLGGP